MAYKMKGSGFYGKGNQSPIKKTYDFNKKKDYSLEATKGNFGHKLAKAVTPKTLLEVLPIGKIGKAGKVAYKYFTS